MAIKSFLLGNAGINELNPDKIPDFEVRTDEAEKNSFYGMPVFSNLQIDGFSYVDDDGVEITVPDFAVDTVLFIVSMSKNIVKTEVQGRSGTVKEFISNGDFQIQIEGAICSNINGIFPEEDLEALSEVVRAPVEIKVYSRFLDVFGINYIVIETAQIGQKLGSSDMLPFSIGAVSDLPIEVEALFLEGAGSTLRDSEGNTNSRG